MIKEVEEKAILIEGWARDGLSQQQIADNLGISLTSLKNYKKKSLPILTAIKKGKEVADYEIENALYNAAIGGNVSAMIFWLKNRRPDKWKDKKEPSEIEIMKRELELKEKKLDFEFQKLNDMEEQIITVNITNATSRIED
ncbi:hypothetical protein PNV01_13385 [Turicibacter sanguinis]|uniref:hypothetical protein n=1 Tax=Turicibacter sanguinis TaxID=154288 RepID=UPI00232C2053|nr:hypothetical protein [Turicibacter sanguinis]MDB8545796.1 hypothetical protein [Turicibacter sanguinis]